MTATYTIPNAISPHIRFRSKPVDARNIKVIIPTYKDWSGLRISLDSLLKLRTPPKQITVANDNPEESSPSWLRNYPVEIINYQGNLGPAKARNRGFGLKDDIPVEKWIMAFCSSAENRESMPAYLRNGYCSELVYKRTNAKSFTWKSDFDWYYFTDCGCTHDPDIFLSFEEAWAECGDCCVAVSGPITGVGDGSINDFMTEQGILNPPLERTLHGVYLPQAIITANALICGLPFAYLGGFDPSFFEAAGEDLDLGIRLRTLGVIAWAPSAKIAHQFKEDELDFRSRFRRYGRGNRKLEIKQGLPSMRAKPFTPEKKEHEHLAELAITAMQEGYDEAVQQEQRGILTIE